MRLAYSFAIISMKKEFILEMFERTRERAKFELIVDLLEQKRKRK